MVAIYRTAFGILALGFPLTKLQAAVATQSAAVLDDIDLQACHMASSTDVGIETGLAEYLTKALVLPNGDRLHFETQHDGDDYLEITNKDGVQVDLSYPQYDNDADDVSQSKDRGIRLITFMGRPYVLHYVGSQSLYLHQIDRVNPARSITPICRFKPNVIVSLTQAEDYVDAPLCDRIQKGRLRVIRENAISNPKPIKGYDILGSARVRVDFMNIGRPITLLRNYVAPDFGFENCTSSVLSVETKPPTREKVLLKQLQDKSSRKVYVPGMLSPGCADLTAQWITENKRTYLEMQSIDYDHPVTEDSEYWFVSTVKGGRARRVCEAFYDRKPPILTSLWNGKTWVSAVDGAAPAID